MAREKAIMAYGTQKDRLRAAAMAELHGTSVSNWLLKLIQEQYRAVYGEVDPEKIYVKRCSPRK